jgi:hypothetical protein
MSMPLIGVTVQAALWKAGMKLSAVITRPVAMVSSMPPSAYTQIWTPDVATPWWTNIFIALSMIVP